MTTGTAIRRHHLPRRLHLDRRPACQEMGDRNYNAISGRQALSRGGKPQSDDLRKPDDRRRYGLWSRSWAPTGWRMATACTATPANIKSSESTVDVGIIIQIIDCFEIRATGWLIPRGADGIVSDWATGTFPGERIGLHGSNPPPSFGRWQFRDGNPPEHDGLRFIWFRLRAASRCRPGARMSARSSLGPAPRWSPPTGQPAA